MYKKLVYILVVEVEPKRSSQKFGQLSSAHFQQCHANHSILCVGIVGIQMWVIFDGIWRDGDDCVHVFVWYVVGCFPCD